MRSQDEPTTKSYERTVPPPALKKSGLLVEETLLDDRLNFLLHINIRHLPNYYIFPE